MSALVTVLIAIFFLIGLATTVAVLVDDDEYEYANHISTDFIQSWLRDMTVEEEDVFKAETLKKICTSKNTSEQGWCIGYMLGFAEGHQISAASLFCADGKFSSEQLTQSFKNYMDDNPQHWGKFRAAVLAASLHESFPCSDADPS